MTQSQLNQEGFIFVANELSIESLTYRSYLNEYGKDETTTPRGIGDRMHIREVSDIMYQHPVNGNKITWSQFNNDNDNEYTGYEQIGEEVYEWQIWSWGTGGNNPHYSGTSFDNEEDAELYYYERSEWYAREKNWNAPVWCSSFAEAITIMSDSVDKSEDVVRRYLKIKEITARKAAEHRAQATKEHDARKAWLAIEVPKEAASITIDEEFKTAVKWAEEAKGNEKSTKMASAMKGLLVRNNKEKVDTDFWQVFRILKVQAELKATI